MTMFKQPYLPLYLTFLMKDHSFKQTSMFKDYTKDYFTYPISLSVYIQLGMSTTRSRKIKLSAMFYETKQ